MDDPLEKIARGVDEAIERAASEGAFDNLPGAGRPLDLGPDRHDEMWLAHHMLKSAGFAPEWIEAGKAARAAQDQVRAEFDQAAVVSRAGDLEPNTQARLQASLATANGRIDTYNLSAPAAAARMPRLDYDTELAMARRRHST